MMLTWTWGWWDLWRNGQTEIIWRNRMFSTWWFSWEVREKTQRGRDRMKGHLWRVICVLDTVCGPMMDHPHSFPRGGMKSMVWIYSHQNLLPYSHSNFFNQSNRQGEWFLLCHWVKNCILWLKALKLSLEQIVSEDTKAHVLWENISKTTCKREKAYSVRWPGLHIGPIGGNSKLRKSVLVILDAIH